MRCLTSGSICPSLIRLLYLSTTSFFVGLTHEVPCDFETMASLSVFSGRCNLCLRPSCQQSDRHADVNSPPQKTWSPVFMCARQPGLTAKSWDMSFFFTHATPTLTPPACLFAAFTTLLGGKRSGCSPWFECTRGHLLQTEQATLGPGNQAPVVKLSEWNVSGFAKLQGVRGRHHDCVKPATKTWHIQNEKLSALTQKEFMNCKYF